MYLSKYDCDEYKNVIIFVDTIPELCHIYRKQDNVFSLIRYHKTKSSTNISRMEFLLDLGNMIIELQKLIASHCSITPKYFIVEYAIKCGLIKA